MRKLISPKKIDKLTQVAVFNSGNTAYPVTIGLYEYNSSTKKYNEIGRIFTTLPYLDFEMRELGSSPYNVEPTGKAGAIFGGSGEHSYGCCGFCKADAGSGVGNLLCTNFSVDDTSGTYFTILVSGYDLSNDGEGFEELQVLARIESFAERYGKIYGMDMTGAESDPDIYADKDPIKYDKDMVEKITKIEG